MIFHVPRTSGKRVCTHMRWNCNEIIECFCGILYRMAIILDHWKETRALRKPHCPQL